MDLTTEIQRQVVAALAEDIQSGDLTAQLIPPHQQAVAQVISRQQAVLCGIAWFDACFKQVDAAIMINWCVTEGESINSNQLLCEITGPAAAILTAERAALNFLQTLSAVATVARRYVETIKGTKAAVMDTRKTLPGLRTAQKYAVTVGGGKNQRMGLFDGILIKENHILAAGGIQQVLQRAQAIASDDVSIQIEVENLNELEQALAAGAQLILLDNMTLDEMRQAVQITRGRAQLEASGGITLENIRAIAETGVDRISIGRLTKDIEAVDLSLRLR